MAELMNSLRFFLPETILIAGLLLLIVADLLLLKVLRRRRLLAAAITLVTLVVAGVVCALAPVQMSGGAPVFDSMIAVDAFARYFKLLFVTAAAIMTLSGYVSLEVEPPRSTEFFTLLLAMTLGMFLLAGANTILMIFLAMEFVSITSYLLTAFKRSDRKSAEAALKYVLYGATASGVMLFGFSYLYGLTGSLELGEIGRSISARFADGVAPQEKLMLSIAAIMVLTGFAYKVAAVPFHMWCPDVYEGAPTPVAALLSVGPKAAGFAALMRFCGTVFGSSGEPWAQLLAIVAVATMTLGNLSAIGQNNVKRLLAYSSIAHAGYMLLAVAVFSADGVAAVMFYLGIYLLMNLGAFVVVMAVRDSSGGREDIDAYRGLGQRNSLLAVALTVFLLSLVGLPPFGGFIGKFYVFVALLSKASLWFYVLAIVAALNSAISLYYYARIIRAMFLTASEASASERLSVTRIQGGLAFVLALAVVVLGLYWVPLRTCVEHSALLLR